MFNTVGLVWYQLILSTSSNGVSMLSCEKLIYGKTVHCQAILPGVGVDTPFLSIISLPLVRAP